MEPATMLVWRVVGVMVVVYTMYCLVWSLLTLAVVVTSVVAMWRYVEKRTQQVLPPGDRVILITGCDSGIGYEVALAASCRGLTVVAGCLDSHSEGAQRLASTDRVHVIQLDVTDDVSIKAAVAEVSKLCGQKGLWTVINNAGFNRQAPVELMSMKTFAHVADVMLFGTVRVTKAFLPLVRRAKGRVVTMSSDRGMLTPAHSAAYCVAKHGVEAFSDVLRAEMVRFDVSVSVIQPGHFGAATAIINSQGIEAMQTSMERDLAQCSEEVQVTYGGQKAVQHIIDKCKASRDVSAIDISPVVEAILRSVLSTCPAGRYPVHGSNGPVDWGIVLGQIKPVVPDTLFHMVEAIATAKY